MSHDKLRKGKVQLVRSLNAKCEKELKTELGWQLEMEESPENWSYLKGS